MRIGLDIMGGDHYPHAPIAGFASVSPILAPAVEVVLIGDQALIAQELEKQAAAYARYSIVHAPDVITMEDKPAHAIVQKAHSSISRGLAMVKSGEIDCFISAGSTGAVMAGAVIMLGCVEGILRPTVGTFFPNVKGASLVCDVGANLEAKAEHLVQFGILGALFLQCTNRVANPTMGLLNVGEEKKKGTAVLQQAYELFQAQTHFPFVGNMQGWDINSGSADVFVCDGLIGNILLKYGESFYSLLKPRLPHDPLVDGYNFEAVGGLPFLGIKGNVIIGHGISGSTAFHNMILRAVEVLQADLLAQIAKAFKLP
jgi:phosphate acyltransferase